MKLQEKYIDVLENLDWQFCYSDEDTVELEWYSPAGEDFIFSAEIKNFQLSVAEYAACFDIDEHVEMWVMAKRNGVSGVPSIRKLVEDAEFIKEMLYDLADKLIES